MYAYIDPSRITRSDSAIQSLSWMNYIFNASTSNTDANDDRARSRSVNDIQEGWLATGNTNNIVSVTYTSMKSDEHLTPPDRTNFNLRAHRTDVRLVSWNVPYQKLATVDEKGVIFVWVKHDNRWSLELINDRSHPVTDMCWSHDGRMTVICYEDGYILAGSVTGQRYWSTVVNNLQTKVSAVTWLPDMSHVILGTTAGQLIVMDHHGNTTEIFSLSNQSIRQLMYSCNKFYPDAPDTNASRFVNDDFMLACSLENGQVLFMNSYQDQLPITVETNLRSLKMDWSSPREILAVGGHKRINDQQCTNEILFYTRRGEFLHRTHIPHTNLPLSALCWAHGNDILFAACGSIVYTIWITHERLPSMLTICQMRIKQHLAKVSFDALDQCALPANLKSNLRRLYPSIIKGFLPDQKHLRAFVCHPLKSHLRLQCTMKRIDQEQEPAGTPGNTQLAGATYVLYLEYLGGLIPLLTAKRISKICPDFIILDPQVKPAELSLVSSPNIHSPQQVSRKSFLSVKSRSNICHEITSVPPSKISLSSNRSSLIGNRNSIHVAESEVHGGRGDGTLGPVNTTSTTDSDSVDSDADESAMSNLQDKSSRKKANSKSMKHRYSNKLCTIAANIWGTRFKFFGHSSHLPDVLGSVNYKTSFLHLQPRQMTVTVANHDQLRQQRVHQIEVKRTSKVQRIRSHPKGAKLDQTIQSSSNANLSSRMSVSPPSQNVLTSSSNRAFKCRVKSGTKRRSPSSSSHLQHRSTIATVTATHQRPTTVNSSSPNSPSTSPMNLSRSTSPAASIANFIRPISPPYIHVKEPLSPKFARASSTTATNLSSVQQCAPTTTTTTTTEPVSSSVVESCFEPEAYRNLSPLNSNQQKKLSFSDPTLNQTTKVSRHLPQSPIEPEEHLSISSLQQRLTPDDDDDDDDAHSDDETENPSSDDEPLPKAKASTNIRQSRKHYTSPRHRMMTCTSGMTDSLPRLSSAPNATGTETSTDTSLYVMQNRPPLWNEQSQVYQLDFGGRVTLESAKNFQIEFKGKQVIQFGRIENNCYTLDFEWPFSPLQAFAVALANITQRLK